MGGYPEDFFDVFGLSVLAVSIFALPCGTLPSPGKGAYSPCHERYVSAQPPPGH